MGEIVLAAKITHVPSIFMSERGGPLEGRRQPALDSLRELGRRARDRGADTFLVFDTHWIANFGYHVNARPRHRGGYTSNEAPHLIRNLAYDYPGNSALGDLIAEEAAKGGLEVLSHRVETLPLEFGAIMPMRYMNGGAKCAVLPIAATIFASAAEHRTFGEAARRAILRSDYKVAVLASGSLSHKLVPNERVGSGQWDVEASEFNRQMDLRVLDLWRERRFAEFCRMLPDYATKCNGEALMADTMMLFGLLGWDQFAGSAEELCPYFPSSGSGQINVEFHLGK